MILAAKNPSKYSVHITSVLMQFDWMKKGEYLRQNCNILLSPNQTKNIPKFEFEIPIDTKVGSHSLKIGVDIGALIDSEWVKFGISFGKPSDHILVSKHPKRDFKVFVSHSNDPRDKRLLNLTENLLDCCGLDAYVAEKKLDNIQLWSKIKREVWNSDSILLLWTKQAAKSADVREEIGIAVGMDKSDQIVSIAEVDLRGSLKGKEFVPLNRKKPRDAILKAIGNILGMAEKKTVTPTPTRTS
jgi:hypothetical protein